jgi:hypothetical protein
MARFVQELNHALGGPLRLFEGVSVMNRLIAAGILFGGIGAGIWAIGNEQYAMPIRIPAMLGVVIAYLSLAIMLAAVEKSRGPWIEVGPLKSQEGDWPIGKICFQIHLVNGPVAVSNTSVIVQPLSGSAKSTDHNRSHDVRWQSRLAAIYRGALKPLEDQEVGILMIGNPTEHGNPCLGIWTLDNKFFPISTDVPLKNQQTIELKLVVNCEAKIEIDGKEKTVKAKPQVFRFSMAPNPDSDIPYKIEGWRRTV